MSSSKKKRVPIDDLSPRKTRQQRRKEEKEAALLEAAENASLVERILPIVFSSGVLIRFETVPLVCKSWREIFLNSSTAWPIESQVEPVEVVSFFSLPGAVRGENEGNSWTQNYTTQQLVTSPAFLRHVLEKLEGIRCSGLTKTKKAQQPVCWGSHAKLAIVWVCYNRDTASCSLTFLFSKQRYPPEIPGSSLSCRHLPRDASCDILGIPLTEPFWRCVISQDFRLLNYTIHLRNQRRLVEWNIENGMQMWTQET